MTQKSAASLAFVAMIILTILLAADFITALLGVLRDIVPVMAMLRSLIYLFAGFSLTLYLYFSTKQG